LIAQNLHVTHITVDTHMEYPAVMGAWAAEIHAQGKHVWFRLGTAQHCLDRVAYLQQMQSLITAHPSFFKAGDIFDSDSESENSCWWTTASYAAGNPYGCPGGGGIYACPNQFNLWVQALKIDADQAFAAAGVSGVITGVNSMDPGTILHVLQPATVSVNRNMVTLDAYPDQNDTDPGSAAAHWVNQLNQIHQRWPGAQVLIGEWGYSNTINVSDAQQQAVMAAETTRGFEPLAAASPWFIGTSYWVGPGSSSSGGYTNILGWTGSSWQLRPAASALAAFYRYEGF